MTNQTHTDKTCNKQRKKALTDLTDQTHADNMINQTHTDKSVQ